MRVSTFFTTLVSLASLAFAEPGEVWTCTKPMGEIGGGCGQVFAMDRCVDFSVGQAGHIRAITQKQGAMCYYYPQKGCSTGQRSLEIDTRKGDYVQDVAENVGRQLVSVHCFHRRQGAGEGEEGAEMQARSEAVINTSSDIDPSKVPGLNGPGDIVVCQDLQLNDGPCETLHATDICAPLGPALSHNVRAIYQAAGTICKFFDRDCSPRHSVLSVNSLEHAVFVPVDTSTGSKLGSVVCRPTWRPDERRTHARSRVLRAASAPVPHSTTTPSPSGFQPLYICRHANLEGRCTFYEEPGCLNNPFGDPTVEPIQSLMVREGWRCALYHEANCAATSPPNYEEARGADKIIGEVGYSVVSMSCMRNPIVDNNDTSSTTTTMSTPSTTTIPAAEEIEQEALTKRHWIGSTTICTSPHFANCKENPNALDTCVTFAGLDGVGAPLSLMQAAGAVCRWYRYTECDGEKDAQPMEVDSRGGFVGMGELGSDGGRFRSVECEREGF